MESILIALLGLVGDVIVKHAEAGQPMTPEIEAAWNKVIAAKEEAADAAARRAKARG